MSKKLEILSKSIYYQIVDLFDVSAIYNDKSQLYYKSQPKPGILNPQETLRERLAKSGFDVDFRENYDGVLIEVKPPIKRKLPKLHIILFIATLATMFFAPIISIGLILEPTEALRVLSIPGFLAERLEYTLALILILLFHEFGHYFTGRRRGVLMSLPYFLPAPSLFGTFGAIIKSRSPILNRRDLIEVGAAGPIAGFVISVVALIIGLQNSPIAPIDSLYGFTLGDSLLLKFMISLIVGPIPEGYDLVLSPASFAGWVGLLVTMLNLLPMGQLDGGHIIYGMFGKAQHIVGKIFTVILIGMGFYWPGWWLFGALAIIFGIKHPPTIEDHRPVPRHARIMGIIAIFIFIICFIPVPLQIG